MSPSRSCLTRMDAKEQTLTLLNKLWVKLQGLPDANPIELGAFFILLTFICESQFSIITHFCVFFKGELFLMLFFGGLFCSPAVVVLLMIVLACLSCCCCRNTKMKGSNIWANVVSLRKGTWQNMLQNVLKKHGLILNRQQSKHFRQLWSLTQGVFSNTRGAKPFNNKASNKHRQGCPDWLPNTPATAARFSGDSSFHRTPSVFYKATATMPLTWGKGNASPKHL